MNPDSGLCHCFKSSVIALWNFPSFRVSQFVTSLEPPALTFYNLALFSIYVNDGTTISRSSVIINVKQISLRKVQEVNTLKLFFRQKFVIPTFGSSVNFIFVLFQVHSNRGVRGWYPIYIMEWKSNSSYPCIKYDHFLPSKIQRSLVPNFSVIEPNVFSFIPVW